MLSVDQKKDDGVDDGVDQTLTYQAAMDDETLKALVGACFFTHMISSSMNLICTFYHNKYYK